jgi:hypothetical protein
MLPDITRSGADTGISHREQAKVWVVALERGICEGYERLLRFLSRISRLEGQLLADDLE